MILIADSGSTKTDWVLHDGNNIVLRTNTSGLNPTLQSAEDIYKVIDKEGCHNNKGAAFNILLLFEEIPQYCCYNHRIVCPITKIECFAPQGVAAHLVEKLCRLAGEEGVFCCGKKVVEVGEYTVEFKGVGVPVTKQCRLSHNAQEARCA